MSAGTIQQMADRVAGLMEERLRIRGRGLGEKLRKGGRVLPRKVRVAATALAQSAEMAQSPKLLLQIDQAALAENYDICLKYLGALNRWERRKAALLGLISSVMFSLLTVVVLLIGVLVWRGFL